MGGVLSRGAAVPQTSGYPLRKMPAPLGLCPAVRVQVSGKAPLARSACAATAFQDRYIVVFGGEASR